MDDALEKRNIMSHAYDEKNSEQAATLIKEKYYDILKALHKMFNEQLKKDQFDQFEKGNNR